MSGSVLEEISLKLSHCKVFLCKFWYILVPGVSPGSLQVPIVELSSFLCSVSRISLAIAFLPLKVCRG